MKSNCLLAAIATWVKHPKRTTIKVRWVNLASLPHFYWHDSNKSKHYHFAAARKDLSACRQIWFRGRIERFYYHGIVEVRPQAGEAIAES